MSRTPTKEQVAKAMETAKALWSPVDPQQEGASMPIILATRGALDAAQARLANIKFDCQHCQHYSLENCAKHGRIPADFLKSQGECEDWRYDGVPF